MTLAAGQTVDFVVFGNNSLNKTTQVDATIVAVPEPATMTLLALSASVVFLRRRK